MMTIGSLYTSSQSSTSTLWHFMRPSFWPQETTAGREEHYRFQLRQLACSWAPSLMQTFLVNLPCSSVSWMPGLQISRQSSRRSIRLSSILNCLDPWKTKSGTTSSRIRAVWRARNNFLDSWSCSAQVSRLVWLSMNFMQLWNASLCLASMSV